MEAERPLGEILLNRRWNRRLEPFPHVVARDVFIPSVVDELAVGLKEVLEVGQGVSHFGWYDALGWSFRKDTDWPLRLFLTPEWHDLVSATMGITCTGHVSGGIHSHAIGSADGTIHHDLNPVYFPETDDGGPVHVVAPDEVDYMSGEVRAPGVTAHRVVRAIALLYYVGNEEWRPGDGGATGLYGQSGTPPSRPDVAVHPVNNSLVMFECTPNSFHTFLTNTRTVRNSVIMWLHRDYDEAADRWGEQSLGLWSAKILARKASA
jgi:hypothetical protein